MNLQVVRAEGFGCRVKVCLGRGILQGRSLFYVLFADFTSSLMSLHFTNLCFQDSAIWRQSYFMFEIAPFRTKVAVSLTFRVVGRKEPGISTVGEPQTSAEKTALE